MLVSQPDAPNGPQAEPTVETAGPGSMEPAGPGSMEPAGRREFDRSRALLAAAVATAVLAGTAAGSAHTLLAGVAAVQAALIVAWVFGTAMPGRIGAMTITGLAAAGADVAVTVWPNSALSPLLAPLGMGVLAMFVHQLMRGVVRARVVESLSGVAMVLVAAVGLTAYVQLRHELDGRSLAVAAILAAGTAVVIGQLVDLVWSRPRLDPEVPRGLVAIVLGCAAAAGAGAWVLRDSPVLSSGRALLLVAAVAVLAALVSVGASFAAHGLTNQDVDAPSEFAVVHRPRPALRPLLVAIVPLSLVAPAAYVLFLRVG